MHTLTNSQASILEHTSERAAGGLYCGDSADMQALVSAGLMQEAGRKSFVPDPYFKLTAAGRAALSQWRAAQPRIIPPKRRRSEVFTRWMAWGGRSQCPFPEFWRATK